MTPVEALDNLDKAAAACNTNREGHRILEQSVVVLRQLIAESLQRMEP